MNNEVVLSGSTQQIIEMLQKIENSRKKSGTYGRVNITAPKNGRGWLFRASVNSQRIQVNRGKTLEHALDGLKEAYRRVQAAEHESSTGETKGLKTIGEALAVYVAAGGKSGTWDDSNAEEVNQILKFWQADKQQYLRCYQVEKKHVRKFYSSTQSRNTRDKRADKFKTFVRWMVVNEYLPASKAEELLTVDKHVGLETRAQLSRSERLRRADKDTELKPIPSHEQVNEFGRAVQKTTRMVPVKRQNGRDYERRATQGYEHGELLVQLLAVTGLRLAEALLLAIPPNNNQKVNPVEINTTEVIDEDNIEDAEGNLKISVDWQSPAKKPHKRKRPKGKKTRTVLVPPDFNVPTGYELNLNLVSRIFEAENEQRNGTNDLGLLFPSPEGKVWTQSNLTRRITGPALDRLGWDITTENDLQKVHAYTLHSLRDRFATTAVDEWGLSPAELTHMGGWKDITVVFRHYYGASAETENSIFQKLNG